MNQFITLLIFTSLLFGQDVLNHKPGE